MSMVYDNWERLVGATLKREELRQIALCPSFSSSISSDFSFDPSFVDGSAPSSLANQYSYGRSVRSLSFREIKKATENFQWKLCIGHGVFGNIVYKGWIHEDTLTFAKRFMRALSRSGTAVAIKKWKQDHTLGYETWLTELKYLSQLDHPNVVKLIGYCSDGGNLVLVYELLRKESLKYHLITSGHQAISWDTRIKVAIGAAKALSFLHDREIPIIHGDFHAGRVLLDGEFNAKLCGFSFAKDGPVVDSTQVVGTSGFRAPEIYAITGCLSVKCDVFGFGGALLEILSGRPVGNLIMAIEENDPMDWVNMYMNDEAKLLGIMDTKLNGQHTPNEALTALTLGLQCLNSDPELRPRMAEVLVVLQQLSGSKNDEKI